MKVVFLKTGNFSIDPVHGPVVSCIENEIADLPDKHAVVLIDYDWAEPSYEEDEPENSKEVKEEDDSEETESEHDDINKMPTPPWEEDDWDEEADDAKERLLAYADEHMDLEINKRKSVKNVIKAIEEALDDDGSR